MHRRWLVNRTNPEYITYLSKTVSISPVFAQILINRGLKTSEEINSFLNPHISRLSDPFDIEGITTAIERITTAARRGEKVLVHGDYDVDGITATAILLKALKPLGIDSYYFIPNRMEHGYGFKPLSVAKAKKIGASLIITVDCGITSFEAAALCKKEGIDVIITDHHEPALSQESGVMSQNPPSINNFLIPDALAVINPKISNITSHLTNLSGAGISLKIAHALSMISESRFTIHDFLDLAALGTIADVVPAIGENRIIVKEGLKLIENGSSTGIQALKNISGIDKRSITTGILLFTLIPRVNASGRISDAHDVVELLLTTSEDKAIDIASWLDKLNAERQQIEEEVYQEALHMLTGKGIKHVIVLSSKGWHKGVIGIVASKIAEAFYRPTFILAEEGHIARGSARSIPPFDIYKALLNCREFLTGFGGHKQAAGIELEIENIPAFDDCINRIAQDTLSDEDYIPSIEIDTDVSLSDISFHLIKEFEMLEPYGVGNPEPLLGSKRLEVFHPKIVGDNHLKMRLKQKNHSFSAIGFDMASYLERLEGSTTFDAVFTPGINEWEGLRSLQLTLKALRPSL